MMFKILILQRYDNLSDAQCEFQIKDRLSFMDFLGIQLDDKVPDENGLVRFYDIVKTPSCIMFAMYKVKPILLIATLLSLLGCQQADNVIANIVSTIYRPSIDTTDRTNNLANITKQENKKFITSNQNEYINKIINSDLSLISPYPLSNKDSYLEKIILTPNKKAIALHETSAMVLKIETSNQIKESTLKKQFKHIDGSAFSSDAKMLAIVEHYKLKIYKTKTWDLLQTIYLKGVKRADDKFYTDNMERSYQIGKVAFSPNGEKIIVIYSGIWIYSVKTGQLLQSFYDYYYQGYALSPNSKILALTEDDVINFWNIDTGKKLKTISIPIPKKGFFNKETVLITFIKFSPDGKVVAIGDENGLVRFYDIVKNQFLNEYLKTPSYITHINFSPNQAIITTTGWQTGTTKLWNFKTKKIIRTIKNRALLPSFSSDGKSLMFIQGKDVKLWTFYNQKQVEQIYKKINKNDFNELNIFVEKHSPLPHRLESVKSVLNAVNNIFTLIKKRSTIKDYQWFAKTFPNSDKYSKAVSSIYGLINIKNTIKDYEWFISEYSSSNEYKKAISGIYKLIGKKNTIKDYEWFASEYPNSGKHKKLVNGIFNLISAKNTIKDYQWFAKTYPNSDEYSSAINAIFSLVEKKNTIKDYEWFASEYPNSGKHKKLVNGIFNLISAKNTIKDYQWFANKYPSNSNVWNINEKIAKIYRKRNTFADFIKAYDLTKSKVDIKNAHKLAKNDNEKKIVEIKITETLSPDKFVKIAVISSTESELKEVKSSRFFDSFKGQTKDYHKTLSVQLDNKSKLFKYANYTVKLKVKLNLKYDGSNEVESEYTNVLLTPENNYKNTVNITYDDIVVYGKRHLAVSWGLILISAFTGGGVDGIDENGDFTVKLNHTSLEYKVLSIEGN